MSVLKRLAGRGARAVIRIASSARYPGLPEYRTRERNVQRQKPRLSIHKFIPPLLSVVEEWMLLPALNVFLTDKINREPTAYNFLLRVAEESLRTLLGCGSGGRG